VLEAVLELRSSEAKPFRCAPCGLRHVRVNSKNLSCTHGRQHLRDLKRHTAAGATLTICGKTDVLGTKNVPVRTNESPAVRRKVIASRCRSSRAFVNHLADGTAAIRVPKAIGIVVGLVVSPEVVDGIAQRSGGINAQESADGGVVVALLHVNQEGLAAAGLEAFQAQATRFDTMLSFILARFKDAPNGYFIVGNEEATDNLSGENNATATIEAAAGADRAIALALAEANANPALTIVVASDSDNGGMNATSDDLNDPEDLPRPLPQRTASGSLLDSN